MRRVFVDANVFLRFFTQDDEGQHEKAKRFSPPLSQVKFNL